MDWARASCWISSAGGLTSRDEYSMTGSVVSVLESVRVRPPAAGSCVRSIDYRGVSCSLLSMCNVHTANIHHPSSNSRRTIRVFCVSTESTASPSEKLLCLISFDIRKVLATRPTSQSLPCPELARPDGASHSPARATPLPSQYRHLSVWSVSWRPWSNRRQSAGRMSHLTFRGKGCIWLGKRVAPE
jgi:hypothetical protein